MEPRFPNPFHGGVRILHAVTLGLSVLNLLFVGVSLSAEDGRLVKWLLGWSVGVVVFLAALVVTGRALYVAASADRAPPLDRPAPPLPPLRPRRCPARALLCGRRRGLFPPLFWHPHPARVLCVHPPLVVGVGHHLWCRGRRLCCGRVAVPGAGAGSRGGGAGGAGGRSGGGRQASSGGAEQRGGCGRPSIRADGADGRGFLGDTRRARNVVAADGASVLASEAPE